MENIDDLVKIVEETNYIKEDIYYKYDINPGLRKKDGTGLLIGLTKVGEVNGYRIKDNKKVPIEGELYYRGLEINKIIEEVKKSKGFYYEKIAHLLLFGNLPNENELKRFLSILNEHKKRFIYFFLRDVQKEHLMSALQRGVNYLYALDKNPDEITIENIVNQSFFVISRIPDILLQGFLRGSYNEGKEMKLKYQELSSAEYFLRMLNNREYTEEEIEIFDLLMLLHAEHGAGNNSTFTVRVMSSAYTDTYSAISAGVGSLKGFRHGGANHMVLKMVDDIKEKVNYNNEECFKAYLRDILNKNAFDKTGLIYGMGHAVYTITDPRAIILKKKAEELAIKEGLEEEFNIFKNVEKFSKEIFKEKNGEDFNICANVDLYSGFVYKMLDIDKCLFTPIFAFSRIPSWCCHRMEQIISEKKIIRPAYKALRQGKDLFEEIL